MHNISPKQEKVNGNNQRSAAALWQHVLKARARHASNINSSQSVKTHTNFHRKLKKYIHFENAKISMLTYDVSICGRCGIDTVSFARLEQVYSNDDSDLLQK